VTECVFCKIRDRKVPAAVVHEDDECLAFEDINPVAPTHILVVPKRHVATVLDASEADAALLGRMQLVAAQIARARGVAESGFRLVVNCNAGAGQSVFHLHLHLIGGRPMRWPPG
jgi:histidine triad (HIT) family protein